MSIVKIKDGNQWVPIQTINGEDGKSAYEYAVEGGYQGTEQEFAQKLADEYVKPTDYASNDATGVVKTSQGLGVFVGSTGVIRTDPASLVNIKPCTDDYKPIVPRHQHEATFYGLAKAAGDSTQSASSNSVGTYTADAKAAIQSMLGTPNKAIIAAEYDATATYALGDVCLHDGSLYKCTTAISTAEAWTAAHWTQITVGGDFVKNTDYATSSKAGVIKADPNYGVYMANTDPTKLAVNFSSSAFIKNGVSNSSAIHPARQHESVFYGLAKAAGDSTQSASSNAVGAYTDSAKSAIKTMIGVPDTTYDLNLGTSITTNANLDTYTTPGIYNADSTVISSITNAPTTTTSYKLIVESTGTNTIRQTVKTIYGDTYIRVGDSSTSSWEFIGWKMGISDVQIDGSSILSDYGVANIPLATGSQAGVICASNTFGIYTDSTSYPQFLRIYKASSENVKAGHTNTNATIFRPIVPYNQHEAVFYGLAEAAGSSMSSSNNPVGTYTDAAKNAIKTMLGTTEEANQVFNISGTDPTITGLANVRYMCGEVYTLSITPPATGTIDVVFTSGSSPTVLTLPNTVIMPDWWAGIEINRTYEIIITDGVYVGVMSWPTTA